MSSRRLGITISLLCFACAPADSSDSTTPDPATTGAATEPQDRVSLAASAGPASIAAGARVVDFDEAGNMVELRAGTNGWMCLPDDPATPGTDPMCLDPAWQQWLEAFVNKATPNIGGIGIGYMFHGGTAPSNTDPFATQPAAGESWIEDGPHMMVVAPNPAQFDVHPTDPANGGPYVMWKGTPYAHLMVPLGPMGAH